jgi:hypothetical protein
VFATIRKAIPVLVAITAPALFQVLAAAQGTAFTYQGRLTDTGIAANGTYDFRFSIFDAGSGGSQIGDALTNPAVAVSGGLFLATLDFGASPFAAGAPRWLEMAVRTNGAGPFTTLMGRQPVTATPYAVQAITSLSAVSAGSVGASNLIGTVPDARLTTNVALLNASANFTGNITAAAFFGDASGLTNLSGSAFRVISPTRSPTGDTNWFGPWTAGTQTAGWQEAIDSLPVATNLQANGGGIVFVRPGVYFTRTNISVARTTPFSLTIRGAGMSASGIVYDGPNAQTALTVGTPDAQSGILFSMENLFVASTRNDTTNLLWLSGRNTTGDFSHLGGIGRASVRFCWFSYWTSMTNNQGHGFTPASFHDGNTKHNLIAINVDCNLNDLIRIEECSFNYVAGIRVAADHARVDANTFEFCGADQYNGQANDWPATSPLSVAAAITLDEPGGLWNGNQQLIFEGNSFVQCYRCYFNNARNSFPIMENDQLEAGDVYIVSAGDRCLVLNPRTTDSIYWFTNNYLATNTTDFSTWKNTLAPTNLVQITDLRKGTFNGVWNGSGAGLTGIPATSITGGTTTVLKVIGTDGGTNKLYFTNGVLQLVQ